MSVTDQLWDRSSEQRFRLPMFSIQSVISLALKCMNKNITHSSDHGPIFYRLPFVHRRLLFLADVNWWKPIWSKPEFFNTLFLWLLATTWYLFYFLHKLKWTYLISTVYCTYIYLHLTIISTHISTRGCISAEVRPSNDWQLRPGRSGG